MRLRRPDLYRFALGFVLGGLAVWAQLEEPHNVVPVAVAAPSEQ